MAPALGLASQPVSESWGFDSVHFSQSPSLLPDGQVQLKTVTSIKRRNQNEYQRKPGWNWEQPSTCKRRRDVPQHLSVSWLTTSRSRLFPQIAALRRTFWTNVHNLAGRPI